MTNAELIKALRECEYCNVCSIAVDGDCPFGGRDALEVAAADALEAADKRIAELKAQLPKDGEWIWEDSVCSPRTCSVCKQKFYIGRGWNYCPNCGAKMDGETEYANTYSLGKIEMPKGAMKKIIADGERKDGDR